MNEPTNKVNDGGPAFPGGINTQYTNLDQGVPTQSGMSLRDYFAAMAMQAMLTGNRSIRHGDFNYIRGLSIAAYAVADNMIAVKALNNTIKDY